jgi:hypothetical protein
MMNRGSRIIVGALLALGLGLMPGIMAASTQEEEGGTLEGPPLEEVLPETEVAPEILAGSLRVVVMDKSDVPVPSVEVVIYRHHHGSWTYVARTPGTDIDGVVLIEGLEPGLYKTEAGKGYSEVCKIGYIEEGKTTTVIIEDYKPAPKVPSRR